MYSIAFVTFIYPDCEKYINDFIISLNKQTILEFDLVIFNDGMKNAESYFKNFKRNVLIIESHRSIIENRYYALNYCKNKNYDKIIFGDCDDFFESNRVQIILKKLEVCDLVVNDLNIVSNGGSEVVLNYLSNRFQNNQIIKYADIKNKNIFGFTNTALNINIINNLQLKIKNVVAVDWYLFTIILLKNYKALFTNETSSNYRQHDKCIVGINNSIDIKFLISARRKHYKALRIPYYSEINREKCKKNILWWEK
jgi:hypothetical protein